MHSLTPNLCLDEEYAKIESEYQTYIHIYILMETLNMCYCRLSPSIFTSYLIKNYQIFAEM